MKKLCQNCHREYDVKPGRFNSSNYCSKACFSRANSVEKVCETCGKAFRVIASRSASAQFCSRDCRTKSGHVVKTCEVCGKVYERPRSMWKDSRYCSVECSGLAQRNRVEIKCETCGKIFERSAVHGRQAKFCSTACAGQAKRVEKVEKTCPECGKVFEVYPSNVDRFICCSMECRSGLDHRFWQQVDVRGLDDCWPWLGTTDGQGYGCIKVGNVMQTVHRISFEQHFGSIPEGLVVRHSCDNKICVNSRHLLLGTHQQNMDDMVERDRQARGSRSGMSKLIEEDIPVIRRLLREGWSQQKIADLFKVSAVNISFIARGKTWTHVKED